MCVYTTGILSAGLAYIPALASTKHRVYETKLRFPTPVLYPLVALLNCVSPVYAYLIASNIVDFPHSFSPEINVKFSETGIVVLLNPYQFTKCILRKIVLFIYILTFQEFILFSLYVFSIGCIFRHNLL